MSTGAFLDGFNLLVLGYFLVLNLFYLTLGILSYFAMRKYALRMKTIDVEELLATSGAPAITLIAPAYNEQAGCVEAAKALLTLRYPDFRILFVNDGSRDGTLAAMIEAFDLKPVTLVAQADLPCAAIRGVYRGTRHPNLTLIDKENGGKADALNAGLNHCGSPLFCAIDADSLLEPDALMRVVRPFLEDASTVAAGGVIRIANGCTVRSGSVTDVTLPANLLARYQVLEYLRAYLAGRMGWHSMQATLIISGAFGLFRHDRVVEAGGFSKNTVGEDMELVVRLHRHCREKRIPYRIDFVPDPVSWTECPETLKVLGRQRDRWQRGLAQTIWRHKTMLLNPRYGRIGMLAYPYFFFLEMLGPILELGGYAAFLSALAIGRTSGAYILAFFMLSVVFGMTLSVGAVVLEELTFRRYKRRADLWRLFALGFLENLGYRQILGWWRVKGIFSLLWNSHGWGQMERKGFRPKAAAAALLAACLAVPAGADTSPPAKGDSALHYSRKASGPGATYADSLALARALAIAGRGAEAIALYAPLLEGHPRDPEARLGRARAYAWRGEAAKAAADARLAIDADSSASEAWQLLGDLHRWNARPDSSIAAYSTALRLSPGLRDARAGRAQAHAMRGDTAAERADRLAAGLSMPEPGPSAPGIRAAVPAKRTFTALASYAGESIRHQPSLWQTVSCAGKWEGVSSALALSAFGARRYGGWDPGVGLDGYAPAWKRAYANLWMEAAPGADFRPRFDYRLEAFQGLTRLTEVSASFRQMRFRDAEVELYGAAGAAYLGLWYLRLDGLLAQGEGNTFSSLATGRRYFSDGGDFAEFKAGFGEAGALWDGGRPLGAGAGWFAAARLRRTSRDGLGASLGLRGGREGALGPFVEAEMAVFVGFGRPVAAEIRSDRF